MCIYWKFHIPNLTVRLENNRIARRARRQCALDDSRDAYSVEACFPVQDYARRGIRIGYSRQRVRRGDVQLHLSLSMVWSGSKGSSQSTKGREKVASRPFARLWVTFFVDKMFAQSDTSKD